MEETLSEMGTPLARIYSGSGRLTGEVAADNVPTNAYDRQLNYVSVGNLTQDEFDAQFLREEHSQCHNGFFNRRDCPDCVSAGFV